MHHTGRAGKVEPVGEPGILIVEMGRHRPGTVSGLPLSAGPRPRKNGTADSAHAAGSGYSDDDSPKQLRSMSVSMMPGFTGTAARPPGSSWAIARVRPSIAHLVAQYGATSGDVERPQPELRLTITPEPRAIIAGAKWRMTFTT